MKKGIKKLWILGILLLFSVGKITVYAEENIDTEEETREADTELIFDADVVVNKTTAKSALADMHGVFVFRSAFITREAIVKEVEKIEKEQIEHIVLTSEQPELNYEEYVDFVLTTEIERFIKDVYIEEEENTLFLWIYCIIISVCILCMAIWIEDILRKKKDINSKIEDRYDIRK